MSAFGGKADMTQIYAMSVRVPLGATPRVTPGPIIAAALKAAGLVES